MNFNYGDITGVYGPVNNQSGQKTWPSSVSDIPVNNWSEHYQDAIHDRRLYRYCRVILFDENDNILDKRVLEVQYQAEAILTINNDIKTRVSDTEGNISTLSQTATAITSTVSSLDASVS